MKVEQRPTHFSSGKIRLINQMNPVSQRPIPKIISSDNLLKSIALLSELEYKTTEVKKSHIRNQCTHCKDFFFTPERKDSSCKACNEIFCLKHRELSQHQCDKVLPSYEKYLLAKSIIKNRLKEVKNKGY